MLPPPFRLLSRLFALGLLTVVTCIISGRTTVAQPYSIPEPCSQYTIVYQGGIQLAAGSIPVDVELLFPPPVAPDLPHPPDIRHHDVPASGASSQTYTFSGYINHVGSIRVFGVIVPRDGRPHRVSTGTPGECVEVTITTDANGCPIITLAAVLCCDTYTISWDDWTVGGISVRFLDGTVMFQDLPDNPDPNLDRTTAAFPAGADNPAVGIVVDGKTLGPGSVYRKQMEMVGGVRYCVEFKVTEDPATGCIVITIYRIPCPPICPEYRIIISDNCQEGIYFPINVDVAGWVHLGFPLDDHWVYTHAGIYTYPMPPGVARVNTVNVEGVDIPMDGLPHDISMPGTNDHKRLRVIAFYDWETGCTTITIDCVYVIG